MLEVVEVMCLTSNHSLLERVLLSLDVLKQGEHLPAELGLLSTSLCLTSYLLGCYPLYLSGLSLLLGDHLLE